MGMPAPIRIPALAVAFVLSLVVLAAALTAPARAEAARCASSHASPAKLSKHRASKSILCLINKERASHGLHAVKLQGKQTSAARKHTRLMIHDRCFAHECPGEGELVRRMERADYLPCDCYWGVGENLAYGVRDYGSPKSIMHAWMNSPEHRTNILNGDYRDIGIGIVWGTPDEGSARSSATYTTDFGYKH
jgi:uncharacterized protein YkwD